MRSAESNHRAMYANANKEVLDAMAKMKRGADAEGGSSFDSEVPGDLHKIVNFSVHGRLAAIQISLHGDTGKEGQDHFCQYDGFHPGLLGFDISPDQVSNKSAAL